MPLLEMPGHVSVRDRFAGNEKFAETSSDGISTYLQFCARSSMLCLLIGGTTAGCAGNSATSEGEGLADAERSIIAGTPDTGDSSVVALLIHGPHGDSYCAGALISPRIVLTAANCVDPRATGSGATFEVLSGGAVSTATHLAVSGIAFDPAFDPSNLPGGHDIGLVQLASPTGLAPLSYTVNAPTDGLVRLVGYGTSMAANAGFGIKRQTTAMITSRTATDINIGSADKRACHGDPGGPAFQVIDGSELIVGVTSYRADLSPSDVCYDGAGYARVDASSSFIDSHATGGWYTAYTPRERSQAAP